MAEPIRRRLSLRRGRRAECQALDFLLCSGLRLVERNYRCRFGEIDLVMLEGDCVVIVEVRYRSASRFSNAINSVGARKQARIALAAESFLARHREFADRPVRFDVVALDGSPGDNQSLEWVRDAFRP